ncbi:hypothetical protein [Neobacillus sp. PS3-40]|uniref:hypothetical protein n=1 Tax=Neobacillus sp. PS3-40 TaxID=3070679 RepID=UPI0027DF5948|nr:hypothetical protein [Neobacillus sp. PS3-40]WML44526.1 hypothetical protein RCG20_01015 [Neobacillus sp. PS3-40]
MRIWKSSLYPIGKILFAVAAALLIISIFFPWWGMTLVAPQYPEGLHLVVYPTKLENMNDLDILNTLNHYIGMKEVNGKDFAELKIIPIVLIAFAILSLLVTFTGKMKYGVIVLGLLCIAGVLGLYDIYHWLSDFGMHLDPKAPIDYKPFIPPMVGENQIANFHTTMGFKLGAYLLGLSFMLMVIAAWRFRK